MSRDKISTHHALLSILVGILGLVLVMLPTSCICDTLSLYHYSGTTFLELPLDSKPFRLTWHFHQYVDSESMQQLFENEMKQHIEEQLMKLTPWSLNAAEDAIRLRHESLAWMQKPAVSERHRLSERDMHYPSERSIECHSSFGSLFYPSRCCVTSAKSEVAVSGSQPEETQQYTTLEHVVRYKKVPISFVQEDEGSNPHIIYTDIELLSSGSIRFLAFLNGPAGDNERKGWILNDDDYLPTERLNAASIALNSIVKRLDHTAMMRTINFEVDVQVGDDFTPLNAAQSVYNLMRDENRKYILEGESSFREAPHKFSSHFLQALSRKDTMEKQVEWQFLYELCLRELAHNTLTTLTDYSIRPNNHTHNDFIANHTFVQEGTLSGVLPTVRPHQAFTSLSLQQIENLLLEHPFIPLSFPIDIFGLVFNHFKGEPVVRKLSNQFDIGSFVRMGEFSGEPLIAIERAVGYIKSLSYFGYYIADQAVVQVSNVELKTIRKLRRMLRDDYEPIIFKYSTMDPETCPNFYNDEYKDIKRAYKKDRAVYGYIATNVYGLSPLIIPRDSIVYHQRTEHRFNVLGRYNPALVQYNVAHLLENKYVEHMFWETYCPGIMPRAVFLPDVLPKNLDLSNGVPPEVFMDSLNKVFPNGWIAKGIWDYNSVGKLVTQDLNITNLITTYRESNFAEVVKKKMQHLAGCEPIEDLNDVIKHHMHYMGWKIDSMLMNPNDVMVQEWIQVEEEQRVECNVGQCPYELQLEDKNTKKKPQYVQDYYQTAVNTKFMECMNKLPLKLRGMPLTADVALAKDGSVYFLETNPGGNSWLLSNDPELIRKHNAWLRDFPSLIRDNRVYYDGMTPREQMDYIRRMMKQWGLTLETHSKRFRFLKDRITDEEHVIPYNMDLNRVDSSAPPPVPRRRIHPEVRRDMMNDALGYIESLNPVLLSSELKLHYVASLANFILYKETNPDFYIRVVHLVRKTRVLFADSIRLPLINKISHFEASASYKIADALNGSDAGSPLILKPQQQMDLGRFIMSCMEDLIDMQTLDIPHEDLRVQLNQYFALFNAQNISSQGLNSLLFQKYRLWNFELFDSVVEMTQSKFMLGSAVHGSYQLLQKILVEFIDVLGAFYAMERTGYEITNLDTTAFSRMWIEKIRTLYDMDIFDWKHPSDNEFVQGAADELVYTVTHILYHFSDYSLFKLNETVFKPEFEFLKKALPYTVKISKDVDIVGEVLDCLLLLTEESEIEDLIYMGQKFLQSRQDIEGGGFPHGGDVHSAVHPSHTAVTGLVDHDYTQRYCCPELGHMVPFPEFREYLRSFGLMMTPHSYYRKEFRENTTMVAPEIVGQSTQEIDTSSNNSTSEGTTTKQVIIDVNGQMENTVFSHHYLKMRLEKYRKKLAEKEEEQRRNILDQLLLTKPEMSQRLVENDTEDDEEYLDEEEEHAEPEEEEGSDETQEDSNAASFESIEDEGPIMTEKEFLRKYSTMLQHVQKD